MDLQCCLNYAIIVNQTMEAAMSRICSICGKRPQAGRSIKRRGLAKKKGGVGKKITGVTKRFFYPNLQKVKALVKGTSKRILVCTKCLKAGKVKKVS